MKIKKEYDEGQAQIYVFFKERGEVKMGLRFIVGRSGTGKTTTCMKEIAKCQQESKGKQIFIVPEQFSSQAENDLISVTDGKGLLFAEVLSFGRLAHRFSTQDNVKIPLEEVGKSMLLRKILIEIQEKLKYFSKNIDKQGFIEQLGRTVTELLQYHISTDQLNQLGEFQNLSKTMQDKLVDLQLIYESYLSFLKHEYVTGDEMLDLLANALSKLENLKDTEVWIDGFYGFTPQEYDVIGQLLRLTKAVTVTLTIDEYSLFQEELLQTAPFFETFVTQKKLCALAKEVGCKIEQPLLLKENKRLEKESLRFLEKYYFQYYMKSCEDAEGIDVFVASNRYAEMEYTAGQIIKLVREKNLRFRDIAVVTNALGDYEKSLKGIFREHQIPYFLDAKKEIISHPFVELVLSAVDNIVFHFQYESMFRYLKTGLALLSKEEIDRLENYVLAYGIKGYKWELPQWNYGLKENTQSEQLQMNELRERVIAPLFAFGEGIEREKTYPVEILAKRVLELVNCLGVPEQLQKQAEKEEQRGNKEKSAQHQQIWSVFITLLEKMVNILGEEMVSLEDFGKILEAGLSNCNMGIIPPTADSVLVGDIERTRLPEVKILFVLGVNEGVLPSPTVVEGIFTDLERETMEQVGIELASGGKRRAFEEQFLIYRGITKPSQHLYFSYCTGDLEGNPWRPSSLISRIHTLFPNMKEIIIDELTINLDCITTPQACFHRIGSELRKLNNLEGIDPIWKDIYSFYATHEEWKQRLSMIQEGFIHDGLEERLSPILLEKMYGGQLQTGVSRLERFAACPFAYFAEYGLKAKERKLFSLQTPDLGVLFHAVLESFSRKIREESKDWKKLTQEETKEYVNQAVSEAVPNLGNAVLLETAANQYLIQRLKRISNRAVWTLVEHVQMGDFVPFDYEIGFGEREKLPPVVICLEDGSKLILRGKIDRVDILDQKENRYVKIIDYKSGEKEFSFRDIYYGLQLQLLIYLDAILNQRASSEEYSIKPGGIFYFHIKDPSIKVTKEMTAEEIQELLFRELRMSGLVLDEPKVIQCMDHIFEMSEKGKLSQGASSVIPVSVNKDGSYKKGGASVMDEDTYQKLLNFATKQAKEIGKRILEGEIAPHPYRKETNTPCTYCSYGSICGFDPTQEKGEYHDMMKIKNEEEFWNKVEENNE